VVSATGGGPHQDWADLAGQELGTAVMQQLLQGLSLHCHLGHILAHTGTGLNTVRSQALRTKRFQVCQLAVLTYGWKRAECNVKGLVMTP